MKLIAALLLAIGISNAQAVEFATTSKGGGEIRLTNVPCKNQTSYVIYSYTKEGNSAYGCWFINGDMVHVTWSDGGNSIYPITRFYKVETNQPQGTQL